MPHLPKADSLRRDSPLMRTTVVPVPNAMSSELRIGRTFSLDALYVPWVYGRDILVLRDALIDMYPPDEYPTSPAREEASHADPVV